MPGAVLPLRFWIAAIGLRRLFASVNSAAPSFVVTTDGGTFAVLVGDASHYGGGQQCFTDLAMGISARVWGRRRNSRAAGGPGAGEDHASHGKHAMLPCQSRRC